MKNRYIVYSVILLLLGSFLCLSSYIIDDYKNKREEDSVEKARKIVSYAENSKNENDILLARDALSMVKAGKDKDELLDIIDNLYISIRKENVLNDYMEILNNIEQSLDEKELLKVKDDIESIPYDEIKNELLNYALKISNKIEENKKESLTISKRVENLKSDAEVIETLYGKITAFTPYCSDGCNGYVASGLFVGNGNIYYNDNEYGTVRIVAADRSYPFGTIVRIKNLWYYDEDVYAIVLDRGGAIGKNKRALFDLLFEYDNMANDFGVENATFEILRLGY